MLTDGQIYGAIAQARAGVLSDMLTAAKLDFQGVEIVRKPHQVRVMLRLRESVDNAAFNLGDVLATEAEINLRGTRAAMVVMGDEPSRALMGALALAAWRSDPACRPAFAEALDREDALRRDQAQKTWAAVAQSRVEFEGGAIEAYSAADRTKGR